MRHERSRQHHEWSTMKGRTSTWTRELAFIKRPWAFIEQPCPVRFLFSVRLLNGFACRGAYSEGVASAF
eukprot:6279676-Pyramimonas_sp.AAC.1